MRDSHQAIAQRVIGPAAATMVAVEKARPAWRRWLGRALPWVVAGYVVWVLLERYSARAIYAHAADGAAGWVAFWAVCAAVLSLFVMATSDWLVFRATLGRVPWSTILRGKGGTSMFQALSYGVGAGGYGFWVARATRTDVVRTVSLIGYIVLSDLTALCIIAAAILYLGEVDIPARLEWVYLFTPLAAVGLFAAALVGPRILPRLPVPRDKRIFVAWSSVPASAYLLSLLGRCANIVLGMVMIWAAARSFNLAIPATVLFTYLPILFCVGVLPINVGGIGAVQAVWVYFFEPYAPGAAILAFQTIYTLALHAGLAARGLPFLASAMRDIDRGAVEPQTTQPDEC